MTKKRPHANDPVTHQQLRDAIQSVREVHRDLAYRLVLGERTLNELAKLIDTLASRSGDHDIALEAQAIQCPFDL